jgi:hypothetical protein
MTTSALAIPVVRSREGDGGTDDSRKEHGHDPQDSSDTLNEEQIFSPMSTAEQDICVTEGTHQWSRPSYMASRLTA